MTDFDPILAFKGKLDFKKAYTWGKDEILDFLKKVAAKPSDYGASDDRKGDFDLLYDRIDALKSPDGTIYKQEKPEQQILRKVGKPPRLDPTKKIPWTVNNLEAEFFIIFDLLGDFLSLMGPAPTAGTPPTAKNYFLPLVVVYARWCRALARSKGFTPTIVQVTWTSKDGGHTWYSFLGASAQGFVKEDQWKNLVGKTRHDYLSGVLQAPWTQFGQSPSKDVNGNSGTNFGNCGETYPFRYILADKDLAAHSYGIALTVASTNDAAYSGSSYWKEGPMLPPCELNCQQLMKWYGVFDHLQNFELWK